MMVVGFFEKTFSEVLLNTIEEVLTNIFREKTAKTIIQSIKLAYNLP